jgi:hypothetical protein
MPSSLMPARERVAWATAVAFLSVMSASLAAASLILGYKILAAQSPEVVTVVRAACRAVVAVVRAGLPGAFVILLTALLAAALLVERLRSPAKTLEVHRG